MRRMASAGGVITRPVVVALRRVVVVVIIVIVVGIGGLPAKVGEPRLGLSQETRRIWLIVSGPLVKFRAGEYLHSENMAPLHLPPPQRHQRR